MNALASRETPLTLHLSSVIQPAGWERLVSVIERKRFPVILFCCLDLTRSGVTRAVLSRLFSLGVVLCIFLDDTSAFQHGEWLSDILLQNGAFPRGLQIDVNRVQRADTVMRAVALPTCSLKHLTLRVRSDHIEQRDEATAALANILAHNQLLQASFPQKGRVCRGKL